MSKKKSVYETEEFKKLQKTWYKKLEKSGFKDIETQSDKRTGIVSPQVIQVDHSRVQYFQKCEDWANNNPTLEPLDRFIFEKHYAGIASVEIAEILTKNKQFPSLHRSAVDRRIQKILKKAGIEAIVFNFN